MKISILSFVNSILGLDASRYVREKRGRQYLDAKFYSRKNDGILFLDEKFVLRREGREIKTDPIEEIDLSVKKKYRFKRIKMEGTDKVKFKQGDRCIVKIKNKLKMGSCKDENAEFILPEETSDKKLKIPEETKNKKFLIPEEIKNETGSEEIDLNNRIELLEGRKAESKINRYDNNTYSNSPSYSINPYNNTSTYNNSNPSYSISPYNNSRYPYNSSSNLSYNNNPYNNSNLSYSINPYNNNKYMGDLYKRMITLKMIETNPAISKENKEIFKIILLNEDPSNVMLMFLLLSRSYNPEEDVRLMNLIKNEIRTEIDKNDIQELKTQSEIQKAMGSKKGGGGLGGLAKMTPMGAIASNLMEN